MDCDTCNVKLLIILPGKRLSLQSHRFRSEHGFIVSGGGLAVVKMQTGSSFAEGDVERFDDDFGRV